MLMRFDLNAPVYRTRRRSHSTRCLVFWGVMLAMIFPAAISHGQTQDTPEKELSIADPHPETVYSWAKQHCEDIDIPDAPARAMRLSNGKILVVAPHYNNRVLVGDSFSTLKKDCKISGSGHESGDPSKFD